MESLLSVIVPVYNVEKYLVKCLKSIIGQTYRDLEIILVNDGSTDGSLDICNQFLAIDQRIKLVNKENGGLSDARNVGISLSNGEYIAFVDSDDSLKLDAFETLIKEMKMKDLDIISAYPISVYENGKVLHDAHKRKIHNQVLSGEIYLVNCIREKAMLWPVQFSVYRKDIVKELKFKKGRLHEDVLWTPQAFLAAQRVECIDYEFYFYLKRNDSITHSGNKIKNATDILNSCYELEKVYSLIDNKFNRAILMDNLLEQYLNGFFIGRLVGKKNKNIVQKRFVLGKSYTAKNRIKTLLFLLNKRLYVFVNALEKGIHK